jgi:hypothetical protein
MRHARRVIAAFSTALILGCGALVASAPAAFAATCSGTGCDAKDPYTTGCAGSGASYYVAETTPLISVATGVASNSYGYIQLWWSNTCHTNWTRMVVNVSGAASGYEDVVLDNPNSAGVSYYDNHFGGAKGAYLTAQIYAPGIPAASDGYLYSSSGSILYYASVFQPGF